MKIARDVCIKYSVLILFALLISGGTLIQGMAFANETFKQTATIEVPGNVGLASFDIGFVDPKLGLYFLADRTNKTIDQIDTSDNSITQLAAGDIVGANGVITANDHKEVWAALNPDATTKKSSVKVIDLATGTVTQTIDTKGDGRSDELCEDPQHHVVLVANDDDADLFLTFISTTSYKIIGTISLKEGTDPNAPGIKATNGIEQCQWNPRTGKFYLAIPEVNGDPDNPLKLVNQEPGGVLEINPVFMKVEKVFPIDFAFLPQTGKTPATADCLGPQGLAIGPQREILLGCSASGTGSVIIDERNGKLIRNLPRLNGNDEVWYNPGDNHYFLAGGNHTFGGAVGGAADPVLGVADQRGDRAVEDASPTTLRGSHSVAADPLKNQVYVPVNGSMPGADALCGNLPPGVTGCIVVFTALNDDPGICGRKETAFERHVCPDNKGHRNGDVN